MCIFDAGHIGLPGRVERRRGHDQHGGVDQPGQPHRHDDVDQFQPEESLGLGWRWSVDASLDERRVQEDDVRHDGGTEDPDRQQHGFGIGEARPQAGLLLLQILQIFYCLFFLSVVSFCNVIIGYFYDYIRS